MERSGLPLVARVIPDPCGTFHNIPDLPVIPKPSIYARNHFENSRDHFGHFQIHPGPSQNISSSLGYIINSSIISQDTPNNFRSPSHIPYLLKQHRTLSVSPYGSRMMQT